MAFRGHHSNKVLLAVAGVVLGLLISLLVGWNLILVENYLLTERVGHADGRWTILTIGSIFFIVVMVSVVFLTRYLARWRERTRFQTVLLDSVTHELKSPLASIKLLMETMRLRTLPSEKQEALQAMIIGDIERLNGLVDHMLEAGRLEHNPRAFDIESVDVRRLVENVIQHVRRRRPQRFEVECHFEGCPERFDTDRPTLDIVLFNLLDNAVKYSPEPAHVTLRAREDHQGRLWISVTDRGIGLTRSQLRRVFRRFYRVQDSKNRRDGVGLGLFVVHSLVKSLGGKAWAVSAGLGQGTSFQFVVPRGTALGDPLLARRGA